MHIAGLLAFVLHRAALNERRSQDGGSSEEGSSEFSQDAKNANGDMCSMKAKNNAEWSASE